MEGVSESYGSLQVFSFHVNAGSVRVAVFATLAVAVFAVGAQTVSPTQKMYVWKDSAGVTHIDSNPGPAGSRKLEFEPMVRPQSSANSMPENVEKPASTEANAAKAKPKQSVTKGTPSGAEQIPQNDEYSRRLADAYHKVVTAKNLGDRSRYKHWLHQYNKLQKEGSRRTEAGESEQ